MYRHAHRHVYRPVHRHVYRHGNRCVHIDMIGIGTYVWMGMYIDIRLDTWMVMCR